MGSNPTPSATLLPQLYQALLGRLIELGGLINFPPDFFKLAALPVPWLLLVCLLVSTGFYSMRRKAAGDRPNTALKVREKWNESAKPICSATCLTKESGDLSRSAAALSFNLSRN